MKWIVVCRRGHGGTWVPYKKTNKYIFSESVKMGIKKKIEMFFLE
jgi:hypothetical protein